MSAELAHSVQSVPASRIRELADIAFGMDGVLRLYFGESSQPTPDFIVRAATRAMHEGYTFYTENAGLPSLREAIADYYQRLHSVRIDPAREIVVTASGVQALNVAIRCVLDPGDEALVLTPAWPNGSSIVKMANARVVAIPQPLDHSTHRYSIDWAALESAVTERTRMLLYTSPSNPLGWVATEEDQERLLAFCRRHNLWLIADEVYERLWFQNGHAAEAAYIDSNRHAGHAASAAYSSLDTRRESRVLNSGPANPIHGPVPSILRKATRDDAVIVIQSFSKSYCMTGWRLGWLVARSDLAAKATQLNEFIVSHAPSFVQRAGETALRDGEYFVGEMVERLKSNRDFCLDAMRQMPRLEVPQPEGAFYIFPRVDGVTDSFDFCKRLLLETKVGIAPGVAFGPGGEGSVRICYAADREVLASAMERIDRSLRKE